MLFINLLNKTITNYKRNGLKNTIYKIYNYFNKTNKILPIPAFTKSNPVDSYSFVLGNIKFKMEEITSDGSKKTINWIVPDLTAPGGGGHINIFRFISYLETHGFENRIYFFNRESLDTKKQVVDIFDEYYSGNVKFPLYSLHTDILKSSDVTFATSWDTAYAVKKINNTKKKFYFIQDFEPFFFPQGSEYAMAEETYKLGFIGITASSWLKNKLSNEYAMKCYDFGFSYDKHLYYPRERTSVGKHIMFYARTYTPRRGFIIGLMALQLLHEKMPEVIIHMAGDALETFEINFPFVNEGVVRIENLPQLYSNCDICFTISCTNISLLPLEVMACKSAVMSNDGEQVKWLLNDKNSILTSMSPESIANKIYEYLSDDDKLMTVKQNGYDFAMLTDWNKECDKVVTYLNEELLNG